ncbi:hypothetical protein M9Y10_004747 [Tritrichomonas musculus]|uniref:DUF3447 domain-containing protein n=1 Tax=Tritrichomonas musculus TaxID=1915356 RepID=A0ABR2JJF3_9EUKA
MSEIPDFFDKELKEEISNLIDIQENILFKNISVEEEDELIKGLASKGYCLDSKFPHLLNISLVYRPKNAHFIKSVITYLNQNLNESYQNIKKYIFTPCSSIDPNYFHILIGLVHLLRICFDANLINFSEIASFCHQLLNEKRTYRVHLILLYLWFMREFENDDQKFSSDLFYFSFKKSKSLIISDVVNYYLDNKKTLKNDNWKVFEELITTGYESSSIQGYIVADDCESLQRIISSSTNFRWNKKLEISLYDPISTLFNEINILNLAAINRSTNCFKYIYLNCPPDQKKFVFPDSFDASIIGGDTDMIHLIEQVPEAFQESIAFPRPKRSIAYAALFHRQEILEWLISTKEYEINEDAIQYAGKSGFALFFVRYFSKIGKFTYDDIVPLMYFHHFTLFKFVMKSKKYDINSASRYGWTALHYAAANGWIDELKFICEQEGVDFNAKNSDNKTAIDCAQTTEKTVSIDIINEALSKQKQ